MKKYLSLILTLIFVINVCFSTPFTLKANAASVDDLTFELNSDGQSYCVASCDTSASGEIEIPDTHNNLPVTNIGCQAFYNCSSLESINIPESVTSIGDSAFSGCDSLTSISLPDNVTNIGAYAFSGCDSLTSVNIPDGVTSISDGAFYNCTSLLSVNIPDGVTSIGYEAFYECDSLTSITLPDSVTIIDKRAFAYCTSLANITIPDSVAIIADYAFYKCTSLTSINIPDSVTNIGDSAFEKCTSLTSVNISNGVTSIGSNAFYDCSSLTSVNIPKSVTNIDSDAFTSCYSLTSVNITDLAAWCNIDFADYDSNPLYHAKNLYLNGDLVTELIIPECVTEIKPCAFSGCTSLTSVTIHNGVTSIGEDAFYNCRSLKSVNIPDGVTSIGDCAFRYCTSLPSVTISDSVTSIGELAFSQCSSLKSVNIPNSVTSIGSEAFLSCSSLTSVNITDLVAWCNIDFADYDSNPLYYAENLYINGDLVTDLVIPDGVTEIKPCAFSGYASLTNVTIPNGVTSIGEDAFYNCRSLKSVNIPDGVTKIDAYAFSGCISLTNVTIPNSITIIGIRAFYDCRSLKSINIPDSVTTIGYAAFYSCSSLTSVNITDLATWCNIDFASDDSNPLYYAKNLYTNGELVTELVIPEGVTEIKAYTFYSYTPLTSVTIPDSVTSIGSYAFYRCNALKYVFYTGSSTDWDNISIGSENKCITYNPIHCNSTKHSHNVTTRLPISANDEGVKEDICPICGFINSSEKLVYMNDYIAAVGDKNVVIDSTNNYIILDISASQNLSEAILPMDGYTLITTPSSDYGFFGTGSKVQVTDSNGTQVAEYTLVVRGDVNGDSVCDVFDLMVMQSATNNPTTLEGAYFVAGDLTEEGEITDTDFEAVVTKALS